jgi:hypothetical protein
MRAKLKKLNGLDLMSYMIMPVQRVPRYVLLLRELRKFTPSSLPEFQALNDALHKIKHIATHINDAKRQVENMSKLIEIQNRISGSMGTTLIAPHRRLIREGVLQTIENKGLFGSIHQKVGLFYLFSDILLWTSQDHKFKGVMNLAAATLTDQSDKTRTGFEITTSTKNLCMHCKDEAEKKDWLEDLEDAVASLQESRDKARQIKQDVLLKKRKAAAHGDRMAQHSLLTSRLHSLSVHSPGSGETGEQQALVFEPVSESNSANSSRRGSFDKNSASNSQNSNLSTPVRQDRSHSAGTGEELKGSPNHAGFQDISSLAVSPPQSPNLHEQHTFVPNSNNGSGTPQSSSPAQTPTTNHPPGSIGQNSLTLRGVALPDSAAAAASRAKTGVRQIASRGARRQQMTLTSGDVDAANAEHNAEAKGS